MPTIIILLKYYFNQEIPTIKKKNYRFLKIFFLKKIKLRFHIQVLYNPFPMQDNYFGTVYIYKDFPCSSVGKESACNAGDSGSISGLGRSPGEGNSNPPHCSCLENPMDRGAWQATYSPWVCKSQTRLSN